MKPSTSRVLTEGLFAGLIGYVAVALTLGFIDLVAGRGFFFTAAHLGGILVEGGGAETTIAPAAVLAYNGIHLLILLVAATVAAWLVFEVELHPVLWYVAFFAFLFAFFQGLVVIMAVGDPRTGGLPWSSVLAGNIVAALAIGVYLHRAHPRLWREVRTRSDPEFE